MGKIDRVAAFDGESVASETRENLDKPSKDNTAMRPYWDQVDTIIRGSKAMRDAGEKYLPKFPDESDKDYKFRLSLSKFTNVYRDVIEGLAARPFESPVTLNQSENVDPPEQIVQFVENVDGAYNNLTVFASSLFFNGINDAVSWVFVDYPKVPPTGGIRTIKDEAALGLRPFWTLVRACNVLEARSAVVSGAEEYIYLRLLEPSEEETDVRIMERVGNVAVWSLWRLDKSKLPTASTNGPTVFFKIDEGVFSIGVIPMVKFFTGRRVGRTEYYHPAMRDAADLQLELYWQESGLKHIKTLTAFPMLAANGVKPAIDAENKPKAVRVGPSAVLYAPPDGSGNSGNWQLLEPSSSSLTFLQSDVKETIQQLRELGRNPLTAQSGNLTVITASVASQKANSAVQMWAFALADALENALNITARWMAVEYDAEVNVYTDFAVDAEGGEALTALNGARKAGDLSQRTYWKELARRAILSPDFDADAEEEALLNEGPTDDGMSGIDPLTGKAITAPVAGK